MLRKLFARAANSAVIWNMAAAGLRVGGMLLVLPIILHNLPTEELGLWYVFLSLGGLASLLDFGFGPTVTRAVGYAWAGAKELKAIGIHSHDEETTATALKPNYELLNRLIATMRDYYRALALTGLVLMLTAGSWWIWKNTGSFPADHRTSLRMAWVFFSFGIAFNTYCAVWGPLLAGINGVRQSQILLALSLIAYYVTVVIGMQLHWGLWAMVLGQFLMGVVGREGGRFYFLRLAGSRIELAGIQRDWHLLQTLWPMAWRNGLVSIGAYLIVNANTLICNAYLGLAETASYGLTLQIISFLVVISQVWVQVKFPLINQMRVHGQFDSIARLFTSRIKIMALSYVVGAITVYYLSEPLLAFIHAKTTIVPSPIFIALLIIYFLEMHHSQYGCLVLTENTNPFMVPALISGVAIATASVILVPRYQLWGIVFAFGGVQLCFNNWWTVWRGIRGLQVNPREYWKLFFTSHTII